MLTLNFQKYLLKANLLTIQFIKSFILYIWENIVIVLSNTRAKKLVFKI